MKKASSHFPWQSSLFSRAIFWLLIILACAPVGSNLKAITISAVYTSACQRDLGVIIDADNAKIRLLTLEGNIKRIDRFSIIYISFYPVEALPISQVHIDEQTELTVINTIYQDEVVELVRGWMIDASENQFSFLTVNGREHVLDNEDIWDITKVTPEEAIHFSSGRPKGYHFVHPYPFMHCNGEAANPAGEHLIYPQHLLEDPLLIKKELDRLNDGYERLRAYHSDKVFYAKPQVYGNDARLGLWGSFGSRYGASSKRNNNFIPEIISEYSNGPFGFQHILVTGNALMPGGVHEEPQMHLYYGLKADYIHFSIMVDFNRYVIGETQYRWHKEDLLESDHRENDTLNISVGFDYRYFSVDLSIWNRIQYGVRLGDDFHTGAIGLNKASLVFENRALKAELAYGFGDDKKKDEIPIPDNASEWEVAYIEAYNAYLARQPKFFTDYALYRLNLTFLSFGPYQPRYSLIVRTIDFLREPDLQEEGAFRYRGASLTNALYMDYPLDDEIRLSGFLSIELLENKHGVSDLSDSSNHIFPKGGVNIALIF